LQITSFHVQNRGEKSKGGARKMSFHVLGEATRPSKTRPRILNVTPSVLDIANTSFDSKMKTVFGLFKMTERKQKWFFSLLSQQQQLSSKANYN
jgi:hypothetical protein